MDHIAKNYSHFVIIAHFNEGGENVGELLKKIPIGKLLILDKKINGYFDFYPCVYQDFQKDIINALTEAIKLIKKDNIIKVVFPIDSYYAKEILIEVKLFCGAHTIVFVEISDLSEDDPNLGELYINLMESDLVTIIKKIKSKNLIVGKDIEIIPYNETPLKEVLLDGITVISTDFEELGRISAQMILNNDKKQIANKFNLIIRISL